MDLAVPSVNQRICASLFYAPNHHAVKNFKSRETDLVAQHAANVIQKTQRLPATTMMIKSANLVTTRDKTAPFQFLTLIELPLN